MTAKLPLPSFLIIIMISFSSLMALMSMVKSEEQQSPSQSLYWTMNNVTEKIEDSYITSLLHSKFRANRADLHSTSYSPLSFLRNKRIVFLGDSLTRYQYVYLIQYIKTGRWTDAYGHDLYCERKYSSWADFYSAYAAIFGCSHICDCRHFSETGKAREIGNMHENMYFYENELNLHVDFFFWVQGRSIASSFFPNHLPNATDFNVYCRDYLNRAPQYIRPNPAIEYHDIHELLEGVLIHEKVDAIIMNYGIWRLNIRNSFLFNRQEEVAPLLKKIYQVTPLFIWKTTTGRSDAKSPMDEDWMLSQLIENKAKIFDAYNYTAELLELKQTTWDGIHFLPFVNRELNIALLEKLEGWLQEVQL